MFAPHNGKKNKTSSPQHALLALLATLGTANPELFNSLRTHGKLQIETVPIFWDNFVKDRYAERRLKTNPTVTPMKYVKSLLQGDYTVQLRQVISALDELNIAWVNFHQNIQKLIKEVNTKYLGFQIHIEYIHMILTPKIQFDISKNYSQVLERLYRFWDQNNFYKDRQHGKQFFFEILDLGNYVEQNFRTFAAEFQRANLHARFTLSNQNLGSGASLAWESMNKVRFGIEFAAKMNLNIFEPVPPYISKAVYLALNMRGTLIIEQPKPSNFKRKRTRVE